eukprot:tig00020685_g12917.t1
MHPSIRAIVSSLFYDGGLRDGSGLASQRRRPAAEALRWHDVQGLEQTYHNSTSPFNLDEVDKVMEVYRAERAKSARHSIAIISLYKMQTRKLRDAIKSYSDTDKRVEVR